jgi:hypothetical protein
MRGHAILQVWKFDEGDATAHTQWCEGWIVQCPNSFQHAFLVEWRNEGQPPERTYTLLRGDQYASGLRAPAGSWFIYGEPAHLDALLPPTLAAAQRAAEPAEVTAGEEAAITVEAGPNAGKVLRPGMEVKVAAHYLRAAGMAMVGPEPEVRAVVVHVDPNTRLIQVVCPASFADQAAFTQALPRFMAVYRGERLPYWREWLQHRVGIPADDQAILAAAALEVPFVELWIPVDSWAMGYACQWRLLPNSGSWARARV